MEHNFTWKNDGRTKVMIGCGTRPEIIRLAAVIKRCREYFDCCVAHTGQNYDKNLNDVFWADFDLGGPDVYMNVVGENLGQTCGNVIARSYELMTAIQPDALLVLGDTNSCLSAISARSRNARPAPRTRPFVVWRGLCLTAGLLLFFCCGGVEALRTFAVNFLVDVVACILSVDVSTFSPMMALLAAFGLCSVAVFVLAQSMPDKTLLGTKRTMQP